MDSLINHEGIHFALLYLALILIYLALILLYIVQHLEERSECFGEKNKVTD